jgi:hypothetical protein
VCLQPGFSLSVVIPATETKNRFLTSQTLSREKKNCQCGLSRVQLQKTKNQNENLFLPKIAWLRMDSEHLKVPCRSSEKEFFLTKISASKNSTAHQTTANF